MYDNYYVDISSSSKIIQKNYFVLIFKLLEGQDYDLLQTIEEI